MISDEDGQALPWEIRINRSLSLRVQSNYPSWCLDSLIPSGERSEARTNREYPIGTEEHRPYQRILDFSQSVPCSHLCPHAVFCVSELHHNSTEHVKMSKVEEGEGKKKELPSLISRKVKRAFNLEMKIGCVSGSWSLPFVSMPNLALMELALGFSWAPPKATLKAAGLDLV